MKLNYLKMLNLALLLNIYSCAAGMQQSAGEQRKQLNQLLETLRQDVQKSDADFSILRRKTWNAIQDLDQLEDEFGDAEQTLDQIIGEAKKKKEAHKKVEQEEPKITLYTPEACKKPNPEKIKKAAENRAKLNEIEIQELNQKFANALCKDSNSSEYFQIIESLLQRGADPNFVQYPYGQFWDRGTDVPQAIICACKSKSSSFVQKLLSLMQEYGLDFNKICDQRYYRNLLNFAANFLSQYDLYNCLLFMVTCGADANQIDVQGRAALHAMASNNKSDLTDTELKNIIKHFIKYGANINLTGFGRSRFPTDTSLTPLFTAIKSNNFRFASLLMELDADPLIPDVNGQTPLEYLLEPRLQRIGKNYKSIYQDPQFVKKFENYMKDYRATRQKVIAEGTPLPNPVAGIIAEYVTGPREQKPSSVQVGPVSQEEQMSEVD